MTMTPRAFSSLKSIPSLTYTNAKNQIFVRGSPRKKRETACLANLPPAHSKQNGTRRNAVVVIFDDPFKLISAHAATGFLIDPSRFCLQESVPHSDVLPSADERVHQSV